MTAEAETVEVANRAAWRRWLERHQARGSGIWLVIHKKGSTRGTLSYEDAVLEAVCFGWIDSTSNGLDDERYKLWMAPRKAGSAWSASNKRRVKALIAEGLMTDAGLAPIEAAKADGSWQALDRSDALEEPDDLLAAFERHRGSRAEWDAFPPGVRKQILEWIYSAKRERDQVGARRGDRDPGGQRRASPPVAPQGMTRQAVTAPPKHRSKTWAHPESYLSRHSAPSASPSRSQPRWTRSTRVPPSEGVNVTSTSV